MTVVVEAKQDFACCVCGTGINTPGFCPDCQRDMDARAEAEHAAQTRALVGDVIAEALQAHLATLDSRELLAANHRAHIRLANAGRGVMDTKRLVDLGTLPQSSLDAARDEEEAARLVLGLVHDRQQINVKQDRVAEANRLATECSACGPEGSIGQVCDECAIDDEPDDTAALSPALPTERS